MSTERPIFIAEIKTQSPFGMKSNKSFVELMEYAIEYGDWISVHDNALWGGDYEAISFVRRCTDKPILAKGLHATDDDIQRALDHGANYVLVVDRKPRYYERIKDCLFEYHSFGVAQEARKYYASPYNEQMKFVVNDRNLRTGEKRFVSELEDYIQTGNWVCQASNIKLPCDVDPRVKAFIVGTHLVDFCKEYDTIGQ